MQGRVMQRLYEESQPGFGWHFWVSFALTVVMVVFFVPFVLTLLYPDLLSLHELVYKYPPFTVIFVATIPLAWMLVMAKFQEFPHFVLGHIPWPIHSVLTSFFCTALFFYIYSDFFDSQGQGLAVSAITPSFIEFVPTMLVAWLAHSVGMFFYARFFRRRDSFVSRRLRIFR